MRTPIREFELANPLYANCAVYFYTVAGGIATATLATLHDAATAGSTLPNPQQLDSNGKFKQPVYIDVQVIGTVIGQSVPTHSTGIISPAPTFRVDPTSSKLQYSYDAGVSWNDTGQTIFRSRGAWLTATAYNTLDLVSQGGALYVALVAHTSGVFATDLAAGRWVAVLTLTASAIANVPAGGIAALNVQDALNELDTEKAPINSPTFTGDPRAPTPTAGDSDTSIATTAFVQAAIVATALGASTGLLDLLHIDFDTGHRDMIAAGWAPAFFNQQWGGAPHYYELVDGATGTLYRFEAATGYVDDSTNTLNIADAAARTGASQGFKVSRSDSYPAIWVKIYKNGNPANNLELRIQADDGTGKPTGNFTAIANGTATAQSGKLHSTDTNGQWVRFSFATPPALTAGTQYHITLKSSGAVDAANFWLWRQKITTGAYPHGQPCSGDATPTWTATATSDNDFLVECPATAASLQTGGVFGDGKLTFFEGATGVLNQSNGRVKDLRDFKNLDLTDFTLLLSGASWTKDKTILDIMYGMDHDRITLRSKAGTGLAELTVLDSSGNIRTVTGTTDISAAGPFQIGIRIMAQSSGADVVKLYINGASEGASLTAQTFGFDKLFGLARAGTFWLGGGFNIASAFAWTQKLDMSVLPSAAGVPWTFTTTSATVEGAVYSVSGGKLYQNKGGFAAAGDGYYKKAAAALSNGNGWSVAAKVRVSSNLGTKDEVGCTIHVLDGTSAISTPLQEYYHSTQSTGIFYSQLDLRSAENVMFLVGKGSDAYTFVNGRLSIDSTGKFTSASATNEIHFGDKSITANENADAMWDYVAYYSTAWTPPQFTGGSLSELALWNGDRTALFVTLWNSGAPFSVKQVCGAQKNYVGDTATVKKLQGAITQADTTASVSHVLMKEMEAFVLGSEVAVSAQARMALDTAAGAGVGSVIYLDGAFLNFLGNSTSEMLCQASTINFEIPHTHVNGFKPTYFGLHKAEFRWKATAGTATSPEKSRHFVAEGRP